MKKDRINPIGIINESTIHSQLKKLYMSHGARSEVPIGGFIADICLGSGQIVEIQTSGFSHISSKLQSLLEKQKVRLVYPLAVEKELIVYDRTHSSVLYRRRSPKKQSLIDMVDELVRITKILSHPNFELEVMLTKEREIRRNDGNGSWRRSGISIIDRELTDIVQRKLFVRPSDYLILLPDELPEQFTNKSLSLLRGIAHNKAQKITYCLRAVGVLRVAGKSKNQYLLERA